MGIISENNCIEQQTNTICYQARGNLYLNITNRCNLQCQFCPKHNRQWVVNEHDLLLRKEPTVKAIIAAIGDPTAYKQIVFCGLGEATLRLNTLLDVAFYLKSKNCFVRLNTSGIVSSENRIDIITKLSHCIDALSISLNAQDDIVYDYHCRPKKMGSYDDLIDFIRDAVVYFDNITLTAIDGLKAVDIQACEKIAQTFSVKFKRRILGVIG